MSEGKILIVSEDLKKLDKIVSRFKRQDWFVKDAGTEDCLDIISVFGPDCLILHINSDSEKSEKEFITDIHNYDDNLPIIVFSGKNKVEDAVSVMKEGAYDYFVTSSDVENIIISVGNAIRLYDLTKKVYFLEQQVDWQGCFADIVGHSSKMQAIFQMISTVAKSNATVLILGESGTGKELVAKAIHKYSKRHKQPFVDINCGAIPRELLENELFGHERGAYTGADKRYTGSCERANGGTLFLDEICEMDPSLQVKILRLLQERTFNRVGGVEKTTVDIRFVAATNRDIEKEVREGRFREDLYYRLNVVPLIIPPLRDRKEDILPVSKCFLEKFGMKNEKIFVDIEPDAADCMLQYSWPGNVRELENTIERVVVLNNDSTVKLKHLPVHIRECVKKHKGKTAVQANISDSQKIIPLELVEKYAIETALNKCNGSVGEASKKLKIGQATLYRKIKQYGLKS